MKFEGERKKKREKLAGHLTGQGFEVSKVWAGWAGWAGVGWLGASCFGTAGGG